MNAAIHVRVSTQAQAAHSYSFGGGANQYAILYR